eukprot:COSAG06_NODE_1487_length_9296_cov_19.025226_4_plen_40_part_00
MDSAAWRAVSEFRSARRDALGCLKLVTTVQLCEAFAIQP